MALPVFKAVDTVFVWQYWIKKLPDYDSRPCLSLIK